MRFRRNFFANPTCALDKSLNPCGQGVSAIMFAARMAQGDVDRHGSGARGPRSAVGFAGLTLARAPCVRIQPGRPESNLERQSREKFSLSRPGEPCKISPSRRAAQGEKGWVRFVGCTGWKVMTGRALAADLVPLAAEVAWSPVSMICGGTSCANILHPPNVSRPGQTAGAHTRQTCR